MLKSQIAWTDEIVILVDLRLFQTEQPIKLAGRNTNRHETIVLIVLLVGSGGSVGDHLAVGTKGGYR